MTRDDRPDPEALLAALKKEEKLHLRGKLKIFLGMSAGVGKTYSMLEAAQKLQKEGVYLIVGVIKTHGREETEQLLNGLKILPEKEIFYRGTSFLEFDLEAALRLHPTLILIDELAHSNVPGSRHPKRWQDVVELLDAGIDVYTTLNVQHIESQKDLVEGIAGVSIRETVPDNIIELAQEIEIIDITPAELLQRLREGKVYLGDKSVLAQENFFQEDRLTALRQLALRVTAEKVDHDLQAMMTTQERTISWKPRERLLVAVGSSPNTPHLIRTTRRLASNLDAPWIALHVDTGQAESDEEKALLSSSLSLARDLGGEVITTQDDDVVAGVKRIARQKGVTQIIAGRSSPFSLKAWFRLNLVDRLSKEVPEIDLHLVRQLPMGHRVTMRHRFRPLLRQPVGYLIAFLSSGFMTLINFFLFAVFQKTLTGGLYFLNVVFLSLFLDVGPILFAAFISTLFWYGFFLNPDTHIHLPSIKDAILLCLFFATMSFAGMLAYRLKRKQEILYQREKSTQAIFEIVRTIAKGGTFKEILKRVQERLSKVLKGNFYIIPKNPEGALAFEKGSIFFLDEKEKAVAIFAFEHGRQAGWSTDTLPSVKRLYIPLKGYKDIVGILAYEPSSPNILSNEENAFLLAASQQLANYIERSLEEARTLSIEKRSQVEQIYQEILRAVSKEFYAPLLAIREEVSSETPDKKHIEKHTRELLRILENITAMARLSEGLISASRNMHSIEEIVEACTTNIKKSLKGKQLIVNIEKNLPKMAFDFTLLEILLYNLLFNAIEHAPENSTIHVKVSKKGNHCHLTIIDEGEKIETTTPELALDTIFRLRGKNAMKIGLGLSIAKMIAEMHKGKITTENVSGNGAAFTVQLPIDTSA